MEDLGLSLLKLFVGHRSICGPEIHGALGHLSNSPAGADGLIVDLNLRELAMIFVEPFRINRVRESCACPIDKDLVRWWRFSLRPFTVGAANAKEREDTDRNKCFHHSSQTLL